MNSEKQDKPRLIISEGKDQFAGKSTTQARIPLYRLIARFRKNAENADDQGTTNIFRFAAEVLSGLVRVFKIYEKNVDD